MKFLHLSSLIAALIAPIANASHIVSGSTSRLPMSLSSVINDLEAEGASRITTVAFLSSRGITQSKRSTLLKKLFGITEESDEDLEDGTTAFGKRMGEEEEEGEAEEGEGAGEDEMEEEGDENVGIAVANPLPGASVNEVAATVQACGGNILYVVSSDDLLRGEGLFDNLAPALERILNQVDDKEDEEEGVEEVANEKKIKNLIVVVEGATTAEDLMAAKSKLENAAAIVLSRIVQPDSNNVVTRLQQVFDSVEFVVSSGPVDELLEDIGDFCDPSEAAASVANAVFQDASSQSTTLAGLNGSPLDLAAARKLLPLSRQALAECISNVQENIGGELVADFGALCDAAVKVAIENFDEKAGGKLLNGSSIAKHIRSDLYEQMYSELGSLYEEQLSLLYTSSFDSFKSNLSRLRLGPTLPTDMKEVADNSVKAFADASKHIYSKKAKSVSWAKADDSVSNFRKELKEFITLRLQKARAQGKFKTIPRGVTLGFHWLLPKPFGNDFRQEPWHVHAKDDLIYTPKDKITDVRPEDVVSGDWRENIVPCPTANEMMYMK